MVASVSLASLVLLTFSAVAAAPPRPHDPGHSATAPAVTLSERAKPPPVNAATGPLPPSAGDLLADDLLAIEASLGDLHGEQAALLRDLIAHTPDSDADDKADYYIRLAELDARTQRVHRLQGAEAQIARDRATDARQRAAATASIAQHQAAADAAVVEVIASYRALTGNPAFARAPHVDSAVFYYAYTLDHAGHPGDARAAYGQLIKSYPGSRFVADAYYALAEAAFDAGQLTDAEALYRKVAALPDRGLAHYAQYKLGWVLFAHKQPEAALEQFYQVATATAPGQPLHHAAIHDLVRAYAEIGRADRALPMFRRVDPNAPYAMLAALGDAYLELGKYEPALSVFRQLMHDQPTSPQVCSWQHAIAQATLVIGKPDDRVREIEQLVRLYTALAARLPASDASECHDAAAEMSGQLARVLHQEAVKTQNAETFTLADRLYRAYLDGFADAADHAETAYYRAELGWAGAELERDPRRATERWQDVGDAFTQVVEAGKLSPQLIQISADAAVQAWRQAVASDPRPAQHTPEQSSAKVTPRPLPPAQARLLAAYDLYLGHVADRPTTGDRDAGERVDVAFFKANLLRDYDHLTEAIPIYQDIVARHPEHETAEYAAQLVMDGLNRLGAYEALIAYAEGLSPALLAAHPAVADTVRKLRAAKCRNRAQSAFELARREGMLSALVRCGELYLELYNDLVKRLGDTPETADTAREAADLLYSAGECFEQGKALSAAIQVFETLRRQLPDSPLAAHALARLGNVYASTAQYHEAADRLEAYAGKFAGEHDAAEALSDAVQFRKGLGDDARAIADTQAFIAKFGGKQPARAADAFFSLTAIYDQQGDLDRLAHHLRAYLDRYAEAGGAARRIEAWSRLGDVLWRQACPVALVDGVCGKLVREPAPRAGAPRTQCGDDSRSALRIVGRDDRLVHAALAAFDHATADYARAYGHAKPDDSVTSDRAARGARYYDAQARFTRLEQRYEQYLALALPAGLDFDPRKPAQAQRSHQRFDAWFIGKTQEASALRDAYQALIPLGDGAVGIAAAARMAAIEQHASAQLYRAEIPADVRSGPFADDASQAYCDTLEQVAGPLETTALDYYQACLTTSTKLGWFSQWSRICERELGHLKPAEYPSTLELRRAPDAVATITQPEPPESPAR